jgi:hypothetical protein
VRQIAVDFPPFRFAFCAFQSRGLSISLQLMHTKLFVLLLAIGLAGICIVNAQSPSATPSPSPTKHRTYKKAAATASPAKAAASPSSGGHPFAAWPKARHAQKKGKAATAASPTPSASPAKY